MFGHIKSNIKRAFAQTNIDSKPAFKLGIVKPPPLIGYRQGGSVNGNKKKIRHFFQK